MERAFWRHLSNLNRLPANHTIYLAMHMRILHAQLAPGHQMQTENGVAQHGAYNCGHEPCGCQFFPVSARLLSPRFCAFAILAITKTACKTTRMW